MRIRFACLCCCTIAAAGCAKADNAAVDTAAPAAAPAPPPPAPVAFADVAGKWNVSSKPESGDTTVTTYVLNATPDSTGWTMTFPNGKPIPIRIVSIGGDSIVTNAGPYASVRRKGQKVTTDGVFRIKDGKLVGVTTARYAVKTADSVLVLRSEGSRVP